MQKTESISLMFNTNNNLLLKSHWCEVFGVIVFKQRKKNVHSVHRIYSSWNIPTAQHNFSPRTTFNVFLCLEVWVFYSIYILHRSQKGKLHFLGLPYLWQRLNIFFDCLKTEEAFSRLRTRHIIWLSCWCRGLEGALSG